jgi:Tat protein translocase TatB subunit
MSLGPEKIILILVVALIVFGPQRLPDLARQVGNMMHELRKLQDQVRAELDQVVHPDLSPDAAAHDEGDHTSTPALPEASTAHADLEQGHDDGFEGPSSFS